MRLLKKYAVLFLASAILAASVLPAYGVTDEEISDAKEEVKESQEALDETNARLALLEKEKKDLENYLAGLNEQLETEERNLTQIGTWIEEKELEITRNLSALERAKIDENNQYEDMKMRIRYMYERSDVNLLASLFTAESFADFLNRADRINEITDYDREKLEIYRSTKEDIASREEELEEENAALEELQKQSRAKQQEITDLAQEVNERITGYVENIGEEEIASSDLQKKIEDQQARVKELEEKAEQEKREAEERARREAEQRRIAEEQAAREEAARKAAEEEAAAQEKENQEKLDAAGEDASYEEEDESASAQDEPETEESAGESEGEEAESEEAESEEAESEETESEEAESEEEEYSEEEIPEEEADEEESENSGSEESAGETSESEPEYEEAEDTSSSGKTYLGTFTLTAYCPCAKCCGRANKPTASGVMPTAGHTVAMGGVPFGTRLLINGTVYTVEDRGTGYGHVDIFMNSHSEALQFGLQYADVYQLD